MEEERRRENNKGFVSDVENDRLLFFFLMSSTLVWFGTLGMDSMDSVECMERGEGVGAGEGVGLVGLAPELVHKVALSGYLTYEEVCALSRTCRRMADVLVWDVYGRDLGYALKGVVGNVERGRWKAARYALRRGWYEGAGDGVWKDVAEVVVGKEKNVVESDDGLRGWEDVVLAALCLPGASGWEGVWGYGRYGQRTSLLHVAASVGSMRVVEWVVERGGDLEGLNEWEETPLLVACKTGRLEVMRRLVEGGADVMARDKWNRNMLYAACEGGDVGLVRYVLGLGVFDVEEKDSDMQTPLHRACEYGQLDAARVLVEEAGADVDVEGNDVCGPLYWACSGGNIGIVRMLVDAGSGSGAGKEGGVWVEGFVVAALRGYADVVRELLGLGVAVDGVEEYWETALCLASRNGRADVVRVLVEEAGADVNMANGHGKPPLYLASQIGGVDVVRVLLELGADVGIVDEDGRTVLDVAREAGLDDVVQLLGSWGCGGDDGGVSQE